MGSVHLRTHSIAVVALAITLTSGATAQSPMAASLNVGATDEQARAANTLLSLALPGAGQLRQGQTRGWAYLAVEVVAWGGWLERRHRGAELRDRYRDLAWDQARLQAGERVDAPFDYYETLTRWERSGRFDAEPAPGVQPEVDPATFNGSIWARARNLFFPPGTPVEVGSAAWNRAIAYYSERAWGEMFLWDWSGNPAAQEEFAGVIEASDDRFRQATNILGLVLANHLIAGADAFLSGGVGEVASSLRIAPDVRAPGAGWLLVGRIGGLP